MDQAPRKKQEETWNHDPAGANSIHQFSDTSLHNDTLQAYEYHRENTTKVRSPEQELFLAQLELAFSDYIDLYPKKHVKREQFLEIYNWFFTSNNTDVGSFDFLCNLFGYDKEWIRKQLMEIGV